MEDVIAWLFFIALIASVVGFFMLRRGETVRFETSSTPRQVNMAAVSIVGNKRKWTTLSQGDGSSNFSYSKGPNILIILLLCFLIFGIPFAILYAIVAGKKEALSVNTDDDIPGMTSVQVQSNGFKGKMLGRKIRNDLALAPGAMAATVGRDAQVATLTGGNVSAAEGLPIEQAPERSGLPDGATSPSGDSKTERLQADS